MKEKVEINQYWAFEHDVSHGFNMLKAKLYNLIEASVIGENQQKAMKGLVKDFANDAFRITVTNMRFNARGANLIGKEDEELPATLVPDPFADQ